MTDMFASASTFKVELDECSKILREAGPRSFVILDGKYLLSTKWCISGVCLVVRMKEEADMRLVELGRGTSTFDGMAIASAVLHHLATHTLPLAFFAVGSRTPYHARCCDRVNTDFTTRLTTVP